MKNIKDYINESSVKDFTKHEIEQIRQDMQNKDGQFYQFMKDKVDSLDKEAIEDYLYNQCFDDDRCLAEFAGYISMVINRNNFNLGQTENFIKKENLQTIL